MDSVARYSSLIVVIVILLTSCVTPSTEVPPVMPTQTQSSTAMPPETPTPLVDNGNIRFSGYEWEVRDSGLSGPGPNLWDGDNVWLDETGDLHLKITHADDGWHCAEVTMTQRLGFGTYQFQVIGRIDLLDPNVVLGLFNYPTEDVGPDATNEIDIEFARWGNQDADNGSYTVWPVQAGLSQTSKSFPFTLSGTYTTHRFTWRSDEIFFQSLAGHRDDAENLIADWHYEPEDAAQHISQQPMPVHINLWLFQGQAPTDGQEVEIVIHKFTFTPG